MNEYCEKIVAKVKLSISIDNNVIHKIITNGQYFLSHRWTNA